MDQALRHLILLVRADETFRANGDEQDPASQHSLALIAALKDVERLAGVPLDVTILG